MARARLVGVLVALCVALGAATDFDAVGNAPAVGRVKARNTAAVTPGPATSATQHQFHLTLAGASKTNAKQMHYTIDWITPATTTSSQLVYGSSADAMTNKIDGKAAGLVDEGSGSSVACWSVVVENVAPGTTIYYTLAGESTSTPQSFTSPTSSFTWAVFGDMGAPMQNGASGVTLPALKNALEVDRAFHGVLNIGDLGYELSLRNGKNYMDEFEAVTSKVPMQTTVGNHEYQYGIAPDFAVQNYYRRFSGLTLGAGTLSGSYSNEFYSFDSGLVHFAFINTEVYGDESFVSLQADGTTWKADETARAAMGKAQAAWLAYDLSRVKRSETPYVVICGHRPPFKTPGPLDASNKFATEIIPVMSKYQVDLYLAGHEHTYLVFEASKFNGYDIPPIIIAGSAGNNEFIREEADLKIKGFTWKTLIPKYGYGYLTATAESLNWEWGSAATDATHKPQPANWSLEDKMTFPVQTSFVTHEAEGSPVKTPGSLADSWPSAKNETGGSGGRDGSSDTGSSSSKAKGSLSTPASNSTAGVASSGARPLKCGAVSAAIATTTAISLLLTWSHL